MQQAPKIGRAAARRRGLCLASAWLCAAALSTSVAAQLPPEGLPAGMPAAATRAEPVLPAPAGWPFGEAFPRTSGAGRLSNGAFFWSDWLFDDMGIGSYAYPFGSEAAHGQNGADIFRSAVGLRNGNTYWRVDWTTLLQAGTPIAMWALDIDADPSTGVATLPAQAGVVAPGTDLVLVMSGSAAYLLNTSTNTTVELALNVDMAARSFVATVPTSLLPVAGNWRIRLLSGLADETGRGFAPAWDRPGSGTPVPASGTRVYNVSYRTLEQEPPTVVSGNRARWNNNAQSTALLAGDIAAFSTVIAWSQLAAAAASPEPMPLGYSQRWFVSNLDLGQGLLPTTRSGTGPPPSTVQVFGRVQPYTVFLPPDYDPQFAHALGILLHGGDGNHNGFLGPNRGRVHGPLCEQRRAICISPFGRGGSTWFVNEGEVDVWEAWRAAAASYRLDPDRTIIGGFSMGGVGATRFQTNHPDLFAAAFVAAGAGYMDSRLRRDQPGDALRAENYWNLPVVLMTGQTDVARTATLNWETFLRSAGGRYRTQVVTSTPNGHGDIGTGVGWDELLPYYAGFSPTRDTRPGRVVFRWAPDDAGRADYGTTIDRAYWVSQLAARDPNARWARIDVESSGQTRLARKALHTDITGPQLSTTARVLTQTLPAPVVPPTPGEPSLELTLSNVAHLAADLQRAGLAGAGPLALYIDSDGPVRLRLDQAAPRSAAVGDTVLAAGRVGALQIDASGGRSRVLVVGEPYASVLATARQALDRGDKALACARLQSLAQVAGQRVAAGSDAQAVAAAVRGWRTHNACPAN